MVGRGSLNMTRMGNPGSAPKICEEPLTGPGVWERNDVSKDDWRMPIPPAALAEIEALGRTLRAHPMETSALDPRDYALDACRRFMARVREALDEGVGFAVLDRLPTNTFDKDGLKKIYWLLSGMIGRPVAQSYDGRLLYDVLDTGARIDTRVRGDLTRQELSWHTDYGFNFPPPHIGLLVLGTAREGGTSSVASMLAIHNVLRDRHPALLRRLYEPFCWNRQGEHAEGDVVVHRFPVFSYDGREVRGRFIKWLLYKGYELTGEPFDRTGRDAIETMFDIMSEPDRHISFSLEPGQIQYVNNYRLAHRRTEYEDATDDPEARRHLVRIFLRDEGKRTFMG